jgi:hypothetical protein
MEKMTKFEFNLEKQSLAKGSNNSEVVYEPTKKELVIEKVNTLELSWWKKTAERVYGRPIPHKEGDRYIPLEKVKDIQLVEGKILTEYRALNGYLDKPKKKLRKRIQSIHTSCINSIPSGRKVYEAAQRKCIPYFQAKALAHV